MSNFVKIYLWSFILFIGASVLLNLILQNLYSFYWILITYIVLLIGTLYTIDKQLWKIVFGFLFWVILFWFAFLYPIKDGSWDGSTYHLEIIQNFIQWNSFLSKDTLDLWSHVYPKNMEILLSIFSWIHSDYSDLGRVIKFVIFWIAVASVYHFTSFTYPNLRKYGIWFIIFGIILHPLLLAQFFTKYIDDMLYCFFILYVIAILSREYILAILLFWVFIWSKLNYVIYAIIVIPLLSHIFYILQWAKPITLFKDFLQFLFDKKKYLPCILILFTLVSSYIYFINIIHYSNPVYPLFWSNKVEVVSNNLPINLKTSSKLTAHVYSFFSYSLSDFNQTAIIMNPFSSHFITSLFLSYKNIEVDTRMSWFGSIWSITLFLSLFHILYIFMYNPKTRKTILYSTATVVIILSVMPFAWARFIPFLYMVPFIIWLWFLGKYRRFYLGLMTFLFTINIILYIASYEWRYYIRNGTQNMVTEYYIKHHDIQIIWYNPWSTQNLSKNRASDLTQKELYHVSYTIPLMNLSETLKYCNTEHIDQLFNLWIRTFDIFSPLVVDCGNGYYLIRTRWYIYQDYLIWKNNNLIKS